MSAQRRRTLGALPLPPSRISVAGALLCALFAACGPVAISKALSDDGSSGTPDTQAPETFLVAGPAAFANQPSATFEFAANESARFEARVFETGTAPGDWTAVTSPSTQTVAGEGTYMFEVRAIDGAGNVDATPSVLTWGVDLEPPSPPAALAVAALDTTVLELEWSSAADTFSGVRGYRVHYATDAGIPNANEGASGFEIGLLNSLRLTGLAPCRAYRVWLTTVDRAGNESDPDDGIERELRVWCGWDRGFSEGLYPVGSLPVDLLATDFDGDGVSDLAVLNTGADNVSRLFGVRGGAMRADPASPLAAGPMPVAIAAADFERDGRMDLVALSRLASGVRRLSLLRGDCGGDLEPAIQAGSTGFLANTCLATTNLRGAAGASIQIDPLTDLLVANAYVRGCSTDCDVCDNGPGPRFEVVCTFTLPPGGVLDCASGDFDGDGRADAAVLSSDAFVRIHRFGSQGGGPGTCSAYCDGATLSVFASAGASSLLAADFDGDGALDLAAGNSLHDFLVVMLGNGDGTFSSPIPYDAGSPTNDLAVADFDGDGILDLAAATSTGVSVLLGNGADGDATFAAPITKELGYPPHSIAAGDFDADGITDVALSVPVLDAIAVLSGTGRTRTGDGTFAEDELLLARAAVDVVHGDFNQDGILDLAAGSADGLTDVYLGNGDHRHADGTFRYASSYAFPDKEDFENFEWTAGDFDGDGAPDLAVSGELSDVPDQGNFAILFGTGNEDGDFEPPMASSHSVYLTLLTAADLDGDGLAELVGVDPDNEQTVRVYRGNAANPLGSGTTFDVPASTVHALALADLDGDGRVDIVIGAPDGIRVALQSLAGTFTLQPTVHPLPPTVDALSIVASDLDSDGIVDLALAGDGPLHVMRGVGTGCAWSSFAPAAPLHAAFDLDRLAASDFDGDGIRDLVARNEDGVFFLRGTATGGRADGGFAAPVAILAGDLGAITIGDFDTDGSLDFAATSAASPVMKLFFGAAGDR